MGRAFQAQDKRFCSLGKFRLGALAQIDGFQARRGPQRGRKRVTRAQDKHFCSRSSLRRGALAQIDWFWDFIESVLEAFEDASSELVHVPDYKIEFRYDIPSFFADFDFINASRFAQYAGINESKMRQYKSGVAFPGEKTTRKILDAIHEIGSHSAQRLRRKIFTLFALFI